MGQPTADEILRNAAEGLGIELGNATKAEQWKAIAERVAAATADWLKILPVNDWNKAVEEVERRRQGDADRNSKRQSQIDRNALHKLVKNPPHDYSTIADFVRDFHVNAQFERYAETTIRDWASEVWPKPTKRGRPKKNTTK